MQRAQPYRNLTKAELLVSSSKRRSGWPQLRSAKSPTYLFKTQFSTSQQLLTTDIVISIALYLVYLTSPYSTILRRQWAQHMSKECDYSEITTPPLGTHNAMSFPTLESENVVLNVSILPPLLRSLSKSSPRNPTQKLHPPPKTPTPRTEDDIKVQPQSVQDDQSIWPPDDTTCAPLVKASSRLRSHLHLELLPTEVLETIAGYLVGRLGSTSSARTGSANVIRNWNEHMRHPRRRDAGDLALVSGTWRGLIQERLYRHSQFESTTRTESSMLIFRQSKSRAP